RCRSRATDRVLRLVGGGYLGTEKHGARHGCGESEERAGEEREVVATGERRELAAARGEQSVGPRGGEAREHGEPECAAHHERGVDDARGEPRLALLNVAHCREQYRVE